MANTRFLAVAVFAISWLIPSATVHSVPILPPIDVIVAQFEDVAFGHEHGPAPGIVQKWEEGLTLAFFRRPGYDLRPHFALIGDHLQNISALTGLRFVPSPNFDDASLRFGFLPVEQFRQASPPADLPEVARFLSSSDCLAVAVRDRERPGRIRQGTIVIGADISPRVQTHCVLEELVQVLGLPNDACHYRPSLFCEDDYVTEMTPADRIVLSVLYDSRLSTGTSRADSLPLVRRIVRERVEGGGV
jgi:hypothetical protein